MLIPRFPAAIPIERAFAALPHGAVHYRAAGSGPVVVALHESPRSSLSLLPVIEALAATHRVIAPDTPGYGMSDPLPGDAPTMDDFVVSVSGSPPCRDRAGAGVVTAVVGGGGRDG